MNLVIKPLWSCHPILALILTVFFSSGTYAAERVVEDSIPVDSDVNFSIKSHRGEVKITTGKVEAIEIKTIITHENEVVVEDVDVDIYKSRSRVSIKADYDQHSSNIGSWFSPNSYQYPHIRFEIILPDEASLKIDSHRSELDIEAPAGRIRVGAHRGEGRIINIRDDFNLDTHRGNFDLEIEELHDVRIDTHRGDIDMEIHKAKNFSIDHSAHRGRVRVSGKDVPLRSHDRNSYIDYKEGEGRNLIKIDSHRGDIDIDFLD